MWSPSTFAEHLVDSHFKSELLNMCLPGPSKCTICDYESETADEMIFHIGQGHGYAIKLYKDFLKLAKRQSRSIKVSIPNGLERKLSQNIISKTNM